MKACPHCRRANAVARESDRWGEYESCWSCGWHQEIMHGPPIPWTPWNPSREYLDPLATTAKIAATKSKRAPH